MYTKPFCYAADGTPLSGLLAVIPPAPVISLVGGGGKTSTMHTLGAEFAARKQKVILTTTTHIKPFQDPLPEGVFCFGTMLPNGKLGPMPDPYALKASCDHLILEADGSKGLPIKVPASHEPVILPETELVIAVMGLTGIGKPISKVCHRIPLVCDFLKKEEQDHITVEDAARILSSPMGLRKDVGHRAYAVVLNQADGPIEREYGRQIAALFTQMTQNNKEASVPVIMTTYRRSQTAY